MENGFNCTGMMIICIQYFNRVIYITSKIHKIVIVHNMLYFATIATDNKADMISSTPCLPCFF